MLALELDVVAALSLAKAEAGTIKDDDQDDDDGFYDANGMPRYAPWDVQVETAKAG